MTLFLNGPVQNGTFTFAGRPGKAAGIRLAEALNLLVDMQPAPHLWNTVTLDGDLRHRTAAATTPLPPPRRCRAASGNARNSPRSTRPARPRPPAS
ncbi:hypothetical protein AB0O20_35420 [Streptomyces kronopolitis]|uniref:hypothetical protein n=1 Tax=Streptomyces kronopolitis TaxID=1612435 RepID=UPI00343018CB